MIFFFVVCLCFPQLILPITLSLVEPEKSRALSLVRESLPQLNFFLSGICQIRDP